MRHLCPAAVPAAVLTAVLAAALLPAAVHADEGVVLKTRPMAPGTKYKSVQGTVMAMDVDSAVGGKSFRVHTEKREAMTYSAEVLAANDTAETRVRVRFLQAEETNQKPGKDAAGKAEKKVDPVAGKTYLVTATGGLPAVAAADGGPVSDEERKKVQSVLSDLGHRDPVCAALAGRTLKPGEAVTVDPSVVRALMKVDEGDKLDVETLSVSLREVRKRKSMPVAVFDVAAHLRGATEEGGGMKLDMQVAGTVEYGLDNCWVVQEETLGPIGMSGSAQSEGRTIVMQGRGTVRSIVRVYYP